MKSITVIASNDIMSSKSYFIVLLDLSWGLSSDVAVSILVFFFFGLVLIIGLLVCMYILRRDFFFVM